MDRPVAGSRARRYHATCDSADEHHGDAARARPDLGRAPGVAGGRASRGRREGVLRRAAAGASGTAVVNVDEHVRIDLANDERAGPDGGANRGRASRGPDGDPHGRANRGPNGSANRGPDRGAYCRSDGGAERRGDERSDGSPVGVIDDCTDGCTDGDPGPDDDPGPDGDPGPDDRARPNA